MFEGSRAKFIKIFYNPQAWHDTFLILNFFVSFTLLLLIWGEVIWALVAFRGATFLTLHYSIYFGVDWLGSVYNFITFGAIATAVFAANFILANWIFNKRKILSYYLAASASLILIFMLVVVSLAAYINWSNPGMS